MGRARKPCEWCEDDNCSEYVTDRNGFCLWAELYPFNNVISVIAQASDENGYMIERSIDIPMNYCPNCGRKLVE